MARRRHGLALLALAGAIVLGSASGAHARPSDRTISGYGIAATLPGGWHGRVTRGTLAASTAPLPPERGWVSTDLARRLRPGDLGVLLFEYEPNPADPRGTSGYRRGRPRPFATREFSAPGPRRQRIARRNFVLAGRYFDLFVEARDRAPTREAVERLNSLLLSLEIEPGDHYPGTVEPARFRQAPGWSVRTQRAVPLGPTTVSITVSATVRHRDRLDALPPRRTLAALPPDGIVLRATLLATNRHVPIADRRDPPFARRAYRLDRAFCGAFEGFPESMRACVLRALVPRQYRIEIWVVYGRKRPTRDQRARAQAQLDRLVLPVWPRWH